MSPSGANVLRMLLWMKRYSISTVTRSRQLLWTHNSAVVAALLAIGPDVLDPLYTLSLYGKHFYFRHSTGSTLHDYGSDTHSQLLRKDTGNYPTGLRFQWHAN